MFVHVTDKSNLLTMKSCDFYCYAVTGTYSSTILRKYVLFYVSGAVKVGICSTYWIKGLPGTVILQNQDIPSVYILLHLAITFTNLTI